MMRALSLFLLLVSVEVIGQSLEKRYAIRNDRLIAGATATQPNSSTEIATPYEKVLCVSWDERVPERIVIAGEGGVARSVTGGKEWTHTLVRSANFIPRLLKASETNMHELWLAATTEHDKQSMTEIWFSRNGGVFWTRALISDRPIEELVLDPGSKKRFRFSSSR